MGCGRSRRCSSSSRVGTVAGKLADVGEGVQQSEFGLDEFWVVAGQAATKGVVLREQDACAAGAHVVTGDQGAEFGEPREGLGARVRVLGSRLGTELNSRRGFGRRTLHRPGRSAAVQHPHRPGC